MGLYVPNLKKNLFGGAGRNVFTDGKPLGSLVRKPRGRPEYQFNKTRQRKLNAHRILSWISFYLEVRKSCVFRLDSPVRIRASPQDVNCFFHTETLAGLPSSVWGHQSRQSLGSWWIALGFQNQQKQERNREDDYKRNKDLPVWFCVYSLSGF